MRTGTRIATGALALTFVGCTVAAVAATNGSQQTAAKGSTRAPRGSGTALATTNGDFGRPIWAHVGSDGTSIDGSRMTSVAALTTGRYNVGFDRDVSKCGYSVTPSTANVFGRVQPAGSQPNSVIVSFQHLSQTPATAEFYLTVAC
jgi:hypothetical protein